MVFVQLCSLPSNVGQNFDTNLRLNNRPPKIQFYPVKSRLSYMLHSYLDYFNSLYLFVSTEFTQVTAEQPDSAPKPKNRQPITPILASLHWNSVNFRIDFKIWLSRSRFKVRSVLTPECISDLLTPYVPQPEVLSQGSASHCTM